MRRLRPSRSALSAAACACAVLLSACEKKYDFEPPSREAQVEEAEGLFDPAMFDSIGWEDPEERSLIGNAIYAARCRRCHGTFGSGGTDYGRQHELDVPSLIREEWPYADVPSLRREIFVGHPQGMPTWGVAGLTFREIDAVAWYVQNQLRPEMLARDTLP